MITRVSRVGWIAGLCLLGLFAALLRLPGRADRPNVLVVTIDTLRADHVGAYGFERAMTPTLDQLAREGTLFEEAISSAPITLPAHSTIFTGLLPPAHGVRDNGAYALPDSADTLAERLQRLGYATQAFVSAVVLAKRYNIHQGFETYDDTLWNEEDPKLFMIRERRAGDTIDRTLEWFDTWRNSSQRKPFFTWVHLFDPHQPHHAPGWTAAQGTSGYDAEISYADQQLARLIDALRRSGELERTLVVLTADHGESLGEHGEKTHAVFVYRATTRVPLIIRYPRRFASGKRIEVPAHHIDIVPTVLAALDEKREPGLSGIDLAMAGRLQPGFDRPLYSESLLSEVGFGMAPLFAVRERRHTWIRAPRPELYDLAADPDETKNMAAVPGYVVVADALDLSLQSLLDQASNQSLGASPNPLSQETMETLQSLGYLQSAAARDAVAGMDPKDGIVIYNELEAARKAGQQGQWAASERLARGILERIPGHASARGVLATALINLGREDEAREQYLELIARNPTEFRVLGVLGWMSLRAGDLDSAERHFKEALTAAPAALEAMSGLGLVAMMRHDEATARSWFDRVLTIDPAYPDVHRLLGDLLYEQERFEDARAAYAKALQLAPGDYRTLIQGAASARRAAAHQQARLWLEEAIRLRTDRWVGHYNLACLDAIEGRTDEALERLSTALHMQPDAADLLAMDPDWDSLRQDPRLQNLLAPKPSMRRTQ